MVGTSDGFIPFNLQRVPRLVRRQKGCQCSPGKQQERFADTQIIDEPIELRAETDFHFGHVVHVVSIDDDLARCGLDIVDQHAERRRFARSIRSYT